MGLFKWELTFKKIRQFSFVVEYVYLACMSILIIRRFQPIDQQFGFYIPLIVDMLIALVYCIVIYVYSGKSREPNKIELVIRIMYLFVAGRLIAETHNPSVQIIIVLPTVIMALRYPLKYTVLTALVTSLVFIVSEKIYGIFEFDYLFIFVSFIWVIGLLVNTSMEAERKLQEDRRKLQEKENLAAIGQMAAGIAHEVRNPLTTIKGFVQLLEKHNGEKDQIVNSYLMMIDKEINRMNSLLKDFLQYAKPGKPELVIKNVNLIILDIFFLLEAHCHSKGVKMETDLASSLPEIQCDENQIKQVIMNIVLNGIDAMEKSEEKLLRIATFYDKKNVCIDIRDSGCGIASDQRAKVFVPFYTTKEQGTGLGLSICYAIIESHNGKIEIESNPDEGSTFTVSLPLLGRSLAGVNNI